MGSHLDIRCPRSTGSRLARAALQLLLAFAATTAVVPGSAAQKSPAAAPASILQRVSMTSGGSDSAQLVLDFSAPVNRKVFTLASPERLVVDLKSARLARGVVLPAGAGPVTAVRSGPQPGNGLRLVLELQRALPSRSTVIQQADGAYRVVVDLGSGSSAAAIAGAPAVAPPVAAQPVVASVPATIYAPAAHAPREQGRDVVVAIDAGHGGEDPGAIGRGGTREKDVTLAIARALATRINAEPGMQAVLTRDADRFVPLRDRMGRARIARADLFVSIHADSIRDASVSGASVYVLSDRGASSEAARWLAERENAADLKGGISLGDKNNQLASVLLDLSQSASIGSSMEAAGQVLGSLYRVGAVRKREVQQAAFVVLKSPDIPSMLIETAYISNPAEEKRLRNATQQARLAESIFSGLREHFRQSPPDGSMFARARIGGAAGGTMLAGGT